MAKAVLGKEFQAKPSGFKNPEGFFCFRLLQLPLNLE